MNYAEIKNSVVVNIIDGRPIGGGGSAVYVPIPDGLPVEIWDAYANSAFFAPDGSARRTEVELLRMDVAAMQEQLDGYEAAYAEGVQDA